MNIFYHILNSGWIKSLGWTLLHSFWQGLLILLLTYIVLKLLRRDSPVKRYMVLCISMILIVLSFVCTFIIIDSSGTVEKFYTETAIIDAQTMIAEPATPQSQGTLPQLISSYARNVSGLIDHYSHIMVSFWFLGFLLFFLRYLGGLFYIHRIKRYSHDLARTQWQDALDGILQNSGVSRSVKILESIHAKVPVTVGHFKPVILFPLGMISRIPPEQFEAILLHEVAHIMRKDYLVNLLQSLVEALFFYHPVVWWLSRNMRIERENICDDNVLNQSTNPLIYIKALATMEEMKSSSPVMANAITGKRKHLSERIHRMVHRGAYTTRPVEGLMTFFVLAVIALLIGAGTNLNDLQAGTRSFESIPAISSEAISSLSGVPLAHSDTFGAESYDIQGLPDNNRSESSSVMERYPAELIAPDTVKDKEKEQQEAQKKAEFAHQEALEKLEEAKQERQEAMKAYQQALQEYHETMKEIKKAQWEKQLVWIQGDSLDSVKVFVKPGLSDVYIFSEDEFDDLPPLPEFIPYEHAKPGEYKYSYKYRYPKRGRVEVYKDGEDVEIILKELEENLEDIYKDIDVEFDVDFDYDFDYDFDTEKEFRKYEKGIRDRQKELERKIIMRPRPEQWEPFHNKPHMFFRDEPGAEQIIRQELLDDSLIRHGKEYIVELGADEMYINGEKQSRSVFKKYKKIYEGVTGEEMEGKVKLIF